MRLRKISASLAVRFGLRGRGTLGISTLLDDLERSFLKGDVLHMDLKAENILVGNGVHRLVLIKDVCQSGKQVEGIDTNQVSRMFATVSWLLPTWFLDEFDPLEDLQDVAKEHGNKTKWLFLSVELVGIVSRFAWKRFRR